jgi:hypothetical protein
MATFKASVQYGDFDGTAAADEGDGRNLHALLEERGILLDDGFLVGVKIFVGENHGGRAREPFVKAFIIDRIDRDRDVEQALRGPEPAPIRSVDVQIGLEEFVGLFKRLEVIGS